MHPFASRSYATAHYCMHVCVWVTIVETAHNLLIALIMPMPLIDSTAELGSYKLTADLAKSLSVSVGVHA